MFNVFQEFAVGVFWIAFYIMSFIACCAKSSQWSNWTPANVHPGYGAAAVYSIFYCILFILFFKQYCIMCLFIFKFFCLVNIILFGALCFLLFRLWRSGTTIQTSSTITTTTTSVKYWNFLLFLIFFKNNFELSFTLFFFCLKNRLYYFKIWTVTEILFDYKSLYYCNL